jgi:glyoxylase-like metal-dependent hydrolase (beta-lactamase superfamily II)
MHRYINCIAHPSSDSNVLIGETHTAIFDCGMAFCARTTIQNVKKALAGRPLDYIFITHTHYDHVGALPFLRGEWPGAKLITSEAGAAVLLKDTPRRVIRQLSAVAAETNRASFDPSYSDETFRADVIVKDGDIINLGGLSVEVLETPGHTRDALSYFVPELKLLILSETTGFLVPDGTLHPCYLTSYEDTINSIEKCRKVDYRYLSLPHRGLAEDKDAGGYFEKSMAANAACRDFILDLHQKGHGQDEMLDMLFKKHVTDLFSQFQPKEAFLVSAKATIACTLREAGKI